MLQVIAINDGSTDGSLAILREYAAAYPTLFFVYDQPNQGIARTRNRGLSLAEGRYILFMDCDDFLDADYIQTYYAAIEQGGLDMVLGGYRRPDAAGKIVKQVRFADSFTARYLLMAPWARILRKEIIDRTGASFFDNAVGEDTAFIFTLLQGTAQISVIDYAGYNWFLNEESVSNAAQRQLTPEMVQAVLRLFERLADLDVLAEDISAEQRTYNQWFAVRTVVFYLLWGGRQSTRQAFQAAALELLGAVALRYPAYRENPLLHKCPEGESKSNHFTVKTLLFLYRHNLLGFFSRFYCKGK
jgi:glycosyltransferase involved in cell wall biosynthesis